MLSKQRLEINKLALFTLFSILITAYSLLQMRPRFAVVGFEKREIYFSLVISCLTVITFFAADFAFNVNNYISNVSAVSLSLYQITMFFIVFICGLLMLFMCKQFGRDAMYRLTEHIVITFLTSLYLNKSQWKRQVGFAALVCCGSCFSVSFIDKFHPDVIFRLVASYAYVLAVLSIYQVKLRALFYQSIELVKYEALLLLLFSFFMDTIACIKSFSQLPNFYYFSNFMLTFFTATGLFKAPLYVPYARGKLLVTLALSFVAKCGLFFAYC